MEFASATDSNVHDTHPVEFDSFQVLVRDAAGVRSHAPNSDGQISTKVEFPSMGVNSQFVASVDFSRLAIFDSDHVEIFDMSSNNCRLSSVALTGITKLAFSPLCTYFVAYCHSSSNADNLFVYDCPRIDSNQNQTEIQPCALISSFHVSLPTLFPLILSAEEFCGGRSGLISNSIISWSNDELSCIRWHESGIIIHTSTNNQSIHPSSVDNVTITQIVQCKICMYSQSPNGTYLAIVTDATSGDYSDSISIIQLGDDGGVVLVNRRKLGSSSSSSSSCSLSWSPTSKFLICIISLSSPTSASYYSASQGFILSSSSSSVVGFPIESPSCACWMTNKCFVTMNMDTVVCCDVSGEIKYQFCSDGSCSLSSSSPLSRKNYIRYSQPYIVIGGFGSMGGDVDIWTTHDNKNDDDDKKKKKKKTAQPVNRLPVRSYSTNCHLACNFQVTSLATNGIVLMYGIHSPRRLVDNQVYVCHWKQGQGASRWVGLSSELSVFQCQLMACKSDVEYRSSSSAAKETISAVKQTKSVQAYVPPHLRGQAKSSSPSSSSSSSSDNKSNNDDTTTTTAAVTNPAKVKNKLKTLRKQLVDLDDEKRLAVLNDARLKEINAEQRRLRAEIVEFESRAKR